MNHDVDLNAEASRIAQERARHAAEQAQRAQEEQDKIEQARREDLHRITGEIALELKALAEAGELKRLKEIFNFVFRVDEPDPGPVIIYGGEGLENVAPLNDDIVYGDSVFEAQPAVQSSNTASPEPSTRVIPTTSSKDKAKGMIRKILKTLD